ncbi:MAG: hypothetical protein JWR44_2056 [Hymenobacter sp.]|nr:hypothetical protein [Hymenobacter sp.]
MHHPLFLIGSFGTTEILLILFVLVLFFGAKRIPELFKGLGQGVREFKDASKVEEEAQFRDRAAAPPVQPPYQQPQQGYSQPTAAQPGSYQQPGAPIFNPNDPNNQPRQ